MLVESELLGTGARFITFGLSAVGLALAAVSAPWRVWLDDRERQWVWLVSLALLVGIWSMKAGFTPGLSLRFLLVTALTLMHGWQLAVIGGAMVLAVLCAVGQADWGSFGAGLLCMAIVPALLTARLHELVHARLPHNYFIYFSCPEHFNPWHTHLIFLIINAPFQLNTIDSCHFRGHRQFLRKSLWYDKCHPGDRFSGSLVPDKDIRKDFECIHTITYRGF